MEKYQKIFKKIKLTGRLKKYILSSLEYIKENNIGIPELNLEGDIYVHLGTKYKTKPSIIKNNFIRDLGKFRSDGVLNKYFNVKYRITIKKLLILLLTTTE